MYREKRRNKILIFVLICILCLMGVGYAAFKTSINITGTTDISSSWDIKIISADVTDTNGTGENVKNTYNDLSASLEANLYEKGDYVEYSIIVENKGTFDAKLETIGITNSNNEAVKITSTGLTKGQTLYKNTTATLKVKIEYNSSYEGDASGTSGEVKIDLDFVQNSGGTIEPEKNHLVTYDYSTNGGSSTNAENECINEGESINLSYTATKEGYEFVGWNTNKNAQEGLKELTMGTSDITLYAIFKIIDTTAPIINDINTSVTTHSILVNVDASDPESKITKYEFKINDNEWIDNGTNSSYTFENLDKNTGYNISVRVINGIDLTAEEEVSESIKLTDNVVTTGDGLYKDATEEGRYIYKGASPNNYVNFNNELWRIVSLENDGTMKLLKQDSLNARAFDTSGNRSSNYCNDSSNGCNAWGSNSTTYDKNGSPVTAISDTYFSSSTYALPNKEASLNTYLNTTYYNSLTSIAQNQIDNHYFNVGTVSASSSNTLETDMLEEGKYKWLGKIGLLNITDYVKASTNSVCDSIYDYDSNTSCYNNSNNHNWLSVTKASYPRYINGSSGSRYNIWGLNHTSYNIGRNGTASANNYGILPALYLKNSVSIISGKGTSTEPYNLGTGVSTSVLDAPTFSEERINNGITVTITYPEGEGLVYEYQKDSGEWQTATQSQKVEFTESGTLVARISDGINTQSASYTIKVGSAGNDLVELAGVVTSGDGLYKDAYEENMYTYRGANPNNYVSFNNELWRIISVNTDDNTIKIMREKFIPDIPFDVGYSQSNTGNGYVNSLEQTRFSYDSYNLCYNNYFADDIENRNYNGCNIWGDNSSYYDSSRKNKISSYIYNNINYKFPDKSSNVNIYLNTTYYNNLDSNYKKMIVDGWYNAGLCYSSQNIETDIGNIKSVQWKGKVGLVDVVEYIKASTNPNCKSVVDYNANNLCTNNSNAHNYMFPVKETISFWGFINANIGKDRIYSDSLWFACGNVESCGGSLYDGSIGTDVNVVSISEIRPVVTLKSSVKITSGNGSSSQPYQLTL